MNLEILLGFAGIYFLNFDVVFLDLYKIKKKIIIFFLEIAVLWVVYLLHFIALPLKHLLVLWDGGAKSVDPNCLMSGPVGEKIKALPDNLKSFVDFKKIDAIIPIVSPKILENQDVKNMYELCKMIITGKKNMKLEKMIIPTIHNARYAVTSQYY